MSVTMDTEKATDALTAALQSAFADIAFIDVVRLPSAPPLPPADKAAIDILKPLSLRLEIAASAALRARISDILFGTDSDRDRDDAFLELVNVASGVFISDYYGAGAEVKLELPRYLLGTAEDEGEIIVELPLDAEGDPVIATIRSVRYRY